MRKTSWVCPLLGLLVAAPIAAFSTDAEAAPRRRRGSGIHQGWYIYGAPAVIHFELETDDFPDIDPSWGWGFGGGYMWTPARYFKVAFGGVFEHHIYNFDFDPLDGSILRLMPEVRLGGGNNIVWGYGLIGMGLGLSIVDFGPGDEDGTSAGFNLQMGGGVQGIVWRNLFLGGELDFDLGFYDDGPFVDDYAVHMLWLKFVIGWYF